MHRARDSRLKTSGDAGRGKAHQGLFTLGDAEMAEQVVSDAVVQECLMRCGIAWRGCGIPADDLCLLAMQGVARPVSDMAAPLRCGRDESSPDPSIQSC
jgi:hypothetical protein